MTKERKGGSDPSWNQSFHLFEQDAAQKWPCKDMSTKVKSLP